ncbi:MAG: universal stress protein [Thermodesulfovibrionia bacterium]|nr:universal stress protein [Thermodesulfovibrionia bacterium]
MGRYRKILVAVDGSETSLHALKESFKLAMNEGSWITVVSVVPPYTGDLDLVAVGNIMASMRKPCEEALRKAQDIANAERASIKTACEEGEPHSAIVDLAQAENFDLIVMGRRGLRRLERVLVGSVTARVIGYSPIDVLVVPRDTEVGWQNVLLTTDGSKYSEAASKKAIDLAKSYGGVLKILSVVDVPPEFYAESPKTVDDMINKAKGYVEVVKKQAEAARVKVETFVREGEAYQVITNIAKEQNAGIIIMGSHGRTGLKRLLMGSVTEKVIGHSPCPVLVVKS